MIRNCGERGCGAKSEGGKQNYSFHSKRMDVLTLLYGSYHMYSMVWEKRAPRARDSYFFRLHGNFVKGVT